MCADRRVKGAEVFVGGLPRSATEGTLREVGFVYSRQHPLVYEVLLVGVIQEWCTAQGQTITSSACISDVICRSHV